MGGNVPLQLDSTQVGWIYIVNLENFLTGIDEVNLNTPQCRIYPNPANYSFTLEFSKPVKDAELIVYDLLGKEMMRKIYSGNKIEMERGNLESGIYFVSVSDHERRYMQKIIVE